jgi:MscS family membrane protein
VRPSAFQLEALESPYAQAAVIMLLAIAAALIVLVVVDRWLKRWAQRTETKLDDVILAMVKPPLLAFIILGGFIAAIRFLPEVQPYVLMVDQFYVIAIIAVAIWVTAKVFRAGIRYYGSELAQRTASNLDDVMVPILEKVGLFFIYTMGVMVLLSQVGIDILPLLTGMGIIGLAVALAAADAIKNFLAGVYILVDQPFRVGDRVILSSGEVCDVVWIGSRSTRLHNVQDNTSLVLQNTELSTAQVVNASIPDERMRTEVELGIAYTSDLDKAMAILAGVLKDHERVLAEPAPEVRVNRFTDFLVWLRAKFWVESYEYKATTESEVRAEALRRMVAADIQVGRR